MRWGLGNSIDGGLVMQNDTTEQMNKISEKNKTSWWIQRVLPIAFAVAMVLPNVAQGKSKKPALTGSDGRKIEIYEEKGQKTEPTSSKGQEPQRIRKWPTKKEVKNAPACKIPSKKRIDAFNKLAPYEAWLVSNNYSLTEGFYGGTWIGFTCDMESRAFFNEWIAQAYGVQNIGSPLTSCYVFPPDTEHYIQTGEWRADPKEVDRYVTRFVVGKNAQKAQQALREFMKAPHQPVITKGHSVSAWRKVCRIVATDPQTGEVDEAMMDSLMVAYSGGCAMRDMTDRGYQGNLLDLFKDACDYVCQNPLYSDMVRVNLYNMLDNAQRSGQWGDDPMVVMDAYYTLGGKNRLER